MTKLLFAAAFVAALAVVATAKPLSVNDNPTPVTCLECTVLGDLVEVLRKQGKTKDQIDTEVQAICARLPMPLKNQCRNAVSTQLDPLLSALDKTNGVVHTACQQIGKCATATLGTSLPDCAVCEVEAAVLKKALKATTADELIANLNMACDRLPEVFGEKCSNIVENKLSPLINELASKPTESSPQACQAVSRCIASSSSNMFEELVGKFVSRPADNPVECLACSVEAALLKNLLQTNTKAQIDANVTMLCNKLPDQLKQKCLDGITNLINPLIDQLVQNQNDTPKQACQAIGKCQASTLEELVEKIVSRSADNPIECLACSAEAALLKNMLHKNTKAQIDARATMLCNKLPGQLKQKCLDGITNLINPLVDQFVQNQNNTPKQACQAIGKCADSSDCGICRSEAMSLKELLKTETKEKIDALKIAGCIFFGGSDLQKCLDEIKNFIDPLIDELVTNPNDSPNKACQVIGKCAAGDDEDLEQLVESATTVVGRCVGRGCQVQDSPVDCIVCAVEAAILNKVLQNNTKADVDKKLADICARLPDQLRVKCNQAVQQKIDPIMDEIAKNPNENPKQVCQAVGRCSADNQVEQEDFEELAAVVAPTVVDPKPGVDCAMCGLESSILAKKLSQGTTKANIDKKLNKLCDKLPKSLRATCHNDVQTKIDPLMDGLLANQYDPKKACQIVGRCP